MNAAITATLRMMRNPRKKSLPEALVDDVKTPDYSANPGLALCVASDCSGLRIDQIMARLLPTHSRSRLQDWIRDGCVVVAGRPVVEPSCRLWAGDVIELHTVTEQTSELPPAENIPLPIVFEDDYLLVIDKPVGLIVHPGNGHSRGTLLNALLYYSPQLGDVPRAGIVHRLDKDTSGLMVIAKTLEAQTSLVRQLQARSVRRLYQALVRGVVERPGLVDAPIDRHPVLRTRMAVVQSGKPARTHYRTLERFSTCTLIECALETGRTHQIRVHMMSIGHPLVGDPVYVGGVGWSSARPFFPRQALHAWRLALQHPATGRVMHWTAPLPDDMVTLLDVLRARDGASVADDTSSGNAAAKDEGVVGERTSSGGPYR